MFNLNDVLYSLQWSILNIPGRLIDLEKNKENSSGETRSEYMYARSSPYSAEVGRRHPDGHAVAAAALL
jgi:hypothetical protein